MRCYYPDGRATGHQQWLMVMEAWVQHRGPDGDLLFFVDMQGRLQQDGRHYWANIWYADSKNNVTNCSQDDEDSVGQTPVAAFCAATEAACRALGTWKEG